MIEEQTTNNDWITQELETLNEYKTEYEDKPSLILEEGKITTFIVHKDKPFEKWTDQATGVVKKIIPVMHDSIEKNLWLNVRNPLYREILEILQQGKRTFSVFTTGKAKETRYSLVKE